MPAPGKTDPVPLQAFMETCRQRVDAALARWLPATSAASAALQQAMRYAVLDGGKRVRPFLVYAAGEAAGGRIGTLDGPACAVELIHAYSLVHDDLPAMDNDALRRGKPTCHVAFGEATALLAGDALQTLAFEILARDPGLTVSAETRIALIARLASAAGMAGMAGGQAIDLEAVGREIGLAELERMHRLKTGALIRAAVALGGLAGGADDAALAALDRYAAAIGLAFQIQDDVLDVESDTATLGKTQGADMALNKPTYPALLGLEPARERAREQCALAIAALAEFDARADQLRALARYVIERVH